MTEDVKLPEPDGTLDDCGTYTLIGRPKIAPPMREEAFWRASSVCPLATRIRDLESTAHDHRLEVDALRLERDTATGRVRVLEAERDALRAALQDIADLEAPEIDAALLLPVRLAKAALLPPTAAGEPQEPKNDR